MRKKFKYMFFLLFIIQITFGQNKSDFDESQISIKSELNFLNTDKRGIKSSDGIIYYVEKDLQTLTAYENGKVKWRTNIIEVYGKQIVGKPEIRFILLKKGAINLIFGKHSYASVDTINGKTTDLGSD